MPALPTGPQLQPLLATSPAELAVLVGGSGRAQRVWQQVRAGRAPFLHHELAPSTRARLEERVDPWMPVVLARQAAPDETLKLLLSMRDGAEVETVLIPNRIRGRTTVCISSQVGCARGCSFCVTATMGLRRSLDVDELVGQVVVALVTAREFGLPEATNVVFMGMGEPLDNWTACQRAISLFVDPHALNLGPRHITVSTVGPSPAAIRQLADSDASIAWSLHAATPETRARLVPTTRHDPVTLRDAFLEVMAVRGGALFVEVALVGGVNDSDAEALAVVELLRPFAKARVNLLPMNPGRPGLQPAPPERVRAFGDVLRRAGFFATDRRTRGSEAGAACGQLATRTGRRPGVATASG